MTTLLAPPAEPPPPAPGGYWSMAEQRERRGAPLDGHDELTIGSVLFSLGLFRAGAAGVTVWLARNPSQCPISEAGGCRSMEVYGWLGFGEGGLMLGTGLTYMIIGGVRRSRYLRWKGGESVMLSRSWSSPHGRAGRVAQQFEHLEIGPWLIRDDRFGRASPIDSVGGGGQLRLRF